MTELKVLTTNSSDTAIATLEGAWHALREHLVRQGITNGEYNLTLTVKGRVDGDQPLVTLELYHYHYQSFDSSKRVAGITWNETALEFLRVLRRDQSLVRITQRTED